jgi:hypothetical protein
MALVGILLAGCNHDITLIIASDRPIPAGVDAMCVGVADTSPGGGHFGKLYPLQDRLAVLPQTLRVAPGGADSALAWVRGDRAGVPVALASTRLDFSGEASVKFDRCQVGPAGLPHPVGNPVGPTNALLVASEGQGGTVVVAVGADGAALLDAHNGGLVARSVPTPPPGRPVALVAADLDGDCDDDVIVATDAAPPEIWLRESNGFVDAGPLGTAQIAALATGDVNHDGYVDVITGGAGNVTLYYNDGKGHPMPAMMQPSSSGLVAVSALALGDVNNDGNVDLIAGQANNVLQAWLGHADGTFGPGNGVVPQITLDVERLQLVDIDGDFAPDLAVAVRNGPLHLYLDRDGQLGDHTPVLSPVVPAPVAHALAFGGWDDACEVDAVIAADAGGMGVPTWHGTMGAVFTAEAAIAPASTDVVMVDIDDDGDLDAVFATSEGAVWLAR